jgi:PadR family transcriptional regulator PadR
MAEATSSFMNGVPELLILRLLREREMYGYELVKAVRVETGNIIKLGEGVIYPTLHGLEREGALKSRRRTINGRTRVYYTLTTSGTKRLAGLTRQWDRIAAALAKLGKEPKHAPSAI